jgi:GNAT superfamily N-acetyltransferase
MKLNIRAANTHDADRVSEILISARKTFLSYAPSPHTDDEVCDWVSNSLIPGAGVLVCELEREVVAMLALSHNKNINWIDQMYIHPQHVNKGIGTALITHVLGSTYKPILLYTFQRNTGARRFYERHGFRAIQFSDGKNNEEQCPDVLYELTR